VAFPAESNARTCVPAGSVLEGLTALFRFLAAEPAYAHIAMVDVLAATARTTERAFKGVTSYAQLLLPGLSYLPAGERPAPVTLEAVTGGIFELILHHALQDRMHELPAMVPRATYFTLAPFIGAAAAAEIAVAAERPVPPGVRRDVPAGATGHGRRRPNRVADGGAGLRRRPAPTAPTAPAGPQRPAGRPPRSAPPTPSCRRRTAARSSAPPCPRRPETLPGGGRSARGRTS
jgi:hypothetical protein